MKSSQSDVPGESLKLTFFGSPELALPSLEALLQAGHRILRVYTQPDRPAGRGRRLLACPVARRARELGLSVSQPQRLSDPEVVEEVRSLGAQAAVVVAFGQLFPPPLLAAFPLGCINLHTSLLPLLRGASPINHAILEGHSHTGVSTMYLDRGLDTGDVILQRKTPIDPQETAGSLAARLAEMGAGLLVETLALAARGQAPRTPQDHSRATYAPKLSKADGLMDWSLSAQELDRRVRGLDPWPSAFTFLQGRQLRLFAPTAVDPHASLAEPPGSLLPPRRGRDDLMWVATGSGALGVGRVQAAGKRQVSAADFLRGARLTPGTRLGET